MQQESHEPYANAQDEDAVALGDRAALHIGDYVGFERVTASRDWRLALGKVVAFPCSRFVKVAYYDPVNRETVALDPISEEVIRRKAEEEGKMELWHDREVLHGELTSALAEEKAATQDLFNARDSTLAKQANVGDMTMDAIRALQASRGQVKQIPPRQWRDLRSRGEPNEDVVRLMRSVLLVLYEDKATSWEEMEPILKDKNFLDRIYSWDCTMTPMSRQRREKIVTLCCGEDLVNSGLFYSHGGASGRRSRTARRRNSATSASAGLTPAAIPPHGEDVGILAPLDAAMRVWIRAQIVCSEAAESQEHAVDECLAEQQAQRVQLRRVNDMRTNISRIEVQMQEAKCAIMGTDSGPNPIMPLEQYPTDTIFYKRTYPDTEGRFVQEVILRDAVLINFGPMAGEDTDGYVRLNKAQADALRTTMHLACIKHDADEMQDLLARKEREEEEIGQLRARINVIRGKPNLTDEDIEELGQLEKLLEDAERRHRATLSRIAELYACGRGAREITMASKRIEAKYTRLHAKMSGDWEEILNDPEHVKAMREALHEDICGLFDIPREGVFDVDARCGSLFIDFTVRHTGEMDDDEMQEMVNNADFSALSLFYERVTFKKTVPLNTPEQEARYAEEMRRLEARRQRENFSGMGIKERLEDYYNADGTLDEEFGIDVTGDVDYRKAIITIPVVREDYEEYAFTGPIELYCDEDQDLTSLASPVDSEPPVDLVRTVPNDSKPDDNTYTAEYGLTETHNMPEDEGEGGEDIHATQIQERGNAASGSSKKSSKKSSPANAVSNEWKGIASMKSTSSSNRTPREREAPQPMQRVQIDSEDEL